MDNFFKELRRRNVVRVAGVYAVAGWVLVQIATTLEDSMNLPAWFDGVVVALSDYRPAHCVDPGVGV